MRTPPFQDLSLQSKSRNQRDSHSLWPMPPGSVRSSSGHLMEKMNRNTGFGNSRQSLYSSASVTSGHTKAVVEVVLPRRAPVLPFL